MVFPKTKNPVGQHRANPVLAVFVKRPQAELKSARLACQRAADDTERGGKSQCGISATAKRWANFKFGI